MCSSDLSIIGDGGFWHNGLSSSFTNMAFNKSDGVAVIVDNYYSAATGGQDVMSSRADNPTKATKHPITKALKGIGIDWVRQVDRTYDVGKMRDVLREALTTDTPVPKVTSATTAPSAADGPMRQVPTGWYIDCALSRRKATRSSSEVTPGPGRSSAL